MSPTSSTREALLGRIRAACQRKDAATALAEIPRGYERCGTLGPEPLIALFEQRLREYGAEIVQVEEADVPTALASMIGQAGVTCVAVPQAISAAWRTAQVTWLIDDDLTAAQIETAGGVLTGASLAVASTGTIVLQHGALEGRRILSLLPDHHFCVLRQEQLVETLPEAMEWIGRNPTLPTTLISGPSATADIEMTRIKGVHGPRNLHVLLVTAEPADSL